MAGLLTVPGIILIWVHSAYSLPGPGPSDLPAQITVRGETVPLSHLKNPFRENREQFTEAVKQGAEIYIKNCFLCHGDLLDGKGLYGESFSPKPANLQKLWSHPPKRENYAFWRIMTGGPGLPPEFKPWNSAMPAWENTLSRDEVWQVISYIYFTIQNPQVPGSPVQPSVDRGQVVFQARCAICHGDKGDGKGTATPFTSPRPRNLVKGHIKFRSTPFGKIPTDKDLIDALTRGMPGTTMPSWNHLGETDLNSLVLYIKTLSKKYAKFIKKGKTHKVIKVPTPPPFALESVERGRQEFLQNCSGCHGLKGRSDGESTKKIVNLASDAIRPRNLTKSWTYRRGFTRRDLFLTLRSGLSTSAMPRFSPRVHSDARIWDIVNYVFTLSPAKKPPVQPEMKAPKIPGEIPLDPDHQAWKAVPAYNYPLGGQVISSEKAYYRTVDSVRVQAVHNGEEIALKLTWDDPTVDPILKMTSTVEESPAPPLPPHLQAKPEDIPLPEEPKPQEIPDALAVQFPASGNAVEPLPYFLNGDIGKPVTLWKWTSYPTGVTEGRAEGVNRIALGDKLSKTIRSQVAFRYGQYQLVLKRKLHPADSGNGLSLESGKRIPFALNAWDGNEGEQGTKKSVSSWYFLTLE